MKTHLKLAAILFAGLLLQPISVVAALCAIGGHAPCAGEWPDAPLEQGAPTEGKATAGPPSGRDGLSAQNDSGKPAPAPLAARHAALQAAWRQAPHWLEAPYAHGQHLYLTTLRLRL